MKFSKENKSAKRKVSEEDRIRINANLPDDFEEFVERLDLVAEQAPSEAVEGEVEQKEFHEPEG